MDSLATSNVILEPAEVITSELVRKVDCQVLSQMYFYRVGCLIPLPIVVSEAALWEVCD